ncbi:MAG: sigma-54-dependent Fis family transcriptional regulator [Deltaproteobacteria bacterium]|nr:MAG: sigma-54-dependent Fis family transcriptional regulator [Deltaproteobacteria bacterium]
MSKILIIEESQKWRDIIGEFLTPSHNLTYWPDGKDIVTLLRNEHFEIVILNIQLEQSDGFGLLNRILQVSPRTPIIAISAIEEASLIVRAVKEGAFDFIVKPFSKEKIQLSIQRGLETKGLKNEIDYLKREQDVVYDFDRIIAYSAPMGKMIDTLKKFSQTDSTILITGETGTGKSFLSGAVHYNSSRREKTFIKINCANIPETLLESELFGHEKGAFTGANKTRIGRLEQGHGGTVFLDEIGEMSPELQAKLLRVLEEKSFERVGGNKTIHSDVRIIAATNRKPEDQVAKGKFREDLYYRLNVLRVHIPPLRERRECIEPLSHYLLEKICRNLRKKIEGFSPQALVAFKSYTWPGNIRQLANTIERAAILEESNMIQTENVILPELNRKPEEAPVVEEEISNTLDDRERDTIINALEESLWIQKDAAHQLGISPRALNYRIKKHGITHTRWRKNK